MENDIVKSSIINQQEYHSIMFPSSQQEILSFSSKTLTITTTTTTNQTCKNIDYNASIHQHHYNNNGTIINEQEEYTHDQYHFNDNTNIDNNGNDNYDGVLYIPVLANSKSITLHPNHENNYHFCACDHTIDNLNVGGDNGKKGSNDEINVLSSIVDNGLINFFHYVLSQLIFADMHNLKPWIHSVTISTNNHNTSKSSTSNSCCNYYKNSYGQSLHFQNAPADAYSANTRTANGRGDGIGDDSHNDDSSVLGSVHRTSHPPKPTAATTALTTMMEILPVKFISESQDDFKIQRMSSDKLRGVHANSNTNANNDIYDDNGNIYSNENKHTNAYSDPIQFDSWDWNTYFTPVLPHKISSTKNTSSCHQNPNKQRTPVYTLVQSSQSLSSLLPMSTLIENSNIINDIELNYGHISSKGRFLEEKTTLLIPPPLAAIPSPVSFSSLTLHFHSLCFSKYWLRQYQEEWRLLKKSNETTQNNEKNHNIKHRSNNTTAKQSTMTGSLKEWIKPVRRKSNEIIQKYYRFQPYIVKRAEQVNPSAKITKTGTTTSAGESMTTEINTSAATLPCLAVHLVIRRQQQKQKQSQAVKLKSFIPYIQAFRNAGGKNFYFSTDSHKLFRNVVKGGENSFFWKQQQQLQQKNLSSSASYNQINIRSQGPYVIRHFEEDEEKDDDDNENSRISSPPPSFFESNGSKANHHRINTETLVDVLAMSKCQFFIYGYSSIISETVIYLNFHFLHNNSINLEDPDRYQLDDFENLVRGSLGIH